MFDQQLIEQLKIISKSCYDKSFENVGKNNNVVLNYLFSAAIIRCLILCVEKNTMTLFETILQSEIEKSRNDLKTYIERIEYL